MQVLGVMLLTDVEEHICVNECYCFPKLPRSDWVHHMDEACPVCNEKSFKIVSNGPQRKPTLIPRKRFWYFGLQHVIGDILFGNAVWSPAPHASVSQPS